MESVPAGGAGIRIFRNSYRGNRNAHYRVCIDGSEKGEIWEGQTKYVDVKAGTHTLQLKTYHLSSNELVLTVESGQIVELACRGRGRFPTLFSIVFRRGMYLDLHLITTEESDTKAKIEAKQPPPPTPRNLGAL